MSLLPLFVPPEPPSVDGSTTALEISARTTAFGDGYEQRAEQSLNPRRRAGRWSWNFLAAADAQAIVNFLSANAVTGFRYQFPTDAAERKWKIDGAINDPPRAAGKVHVDAAVMEIFDP